MGGRMGPRNACSWCHVFTIKLFEGKCASCYAHFMQNSAKQKQIEFFENARISINNKMVTSPVLCQSVVEVAKTSRMAFQGHQ